MWSVLAFSSKLDGVRRQPNVCCLGAVNVRPDYFHDGDILARVEVLDNPSLCCRERSTIFLLKLVGFFMQLEVEQLF